MKKILKYIYRIILGLIAVVIVIIVIAAVVIQTGAFKRKLAGIAVKQGSEYINGELSVGRIEGNFFSMIVLKDLLITDNPDTLIYIEEIDANFSLWPLLRSKVVISSVTIKKPYLFLQQLNDSTWNLSQIIKIPQKEKKENEKENKFEIGIKSLALITGELKIESADSIIPQQIENLNADLSFLYSKNRQRVTINNLTLEAYTPDISLQNLSFELKHENQNIELKNFFLKTAQNQISSEGNFNTGPRPEGYVTLNSSPIMLSEFEFLLSGFQPRVTPILRLDAKIRNDSLIASIKLIEKSEDLFIDMSLGNLRSLISNKTDSMVCYKITGELNKITVANWSGIQNLDYILNGSILAEGIGIKPETAVAHLAGEFRNSVAEQLAIDRLDFAFDIDHGSLRGYTTGSGDFGALEVYPVIHDFMGERPTYTLRLLTQQLNIAVLTGIDTLQSNITLKANINGTGFDPEMLSVHAIVLVSPSNLFDIEIDTLFAKAAYSNKNLTIDTLRIITQTIDATGYGSYAVNSTSDMIFTASIESLDEIKRFIPLKDVQATGKIEAHLKGTADSVKIDALMALGQIEYDSIYSDSITLDASVLMTGNDTLIYADISVSNLRNKSFQLDSVTVKLTATPDSAFGKVHLTNQNLITDLSAGVNYDKNLRVGLEDLIIEYKDQKWALKQQPAIFEMDSGIYRLTNFELVEKNIDSTARIMANGIFSMVGTEDFKIELVNIDVAKTAKTFYKEIDASGKLNLAMELQGTAASPDLKSKFDIKDPIFNKFKISEFSGDLDYRSDLLKVTSKIVPQDSGRFEFSGEIPIVLRLDSIHYQLKPDDPLVANLTVDRFSLAILQAMGLAGEIEGFINGIINVGGTIENPVSEGNLQLQHAKLKVPKYGIDYRKIEMNVNFLDNMISLDTLFVKTSDGTMTGNGKIDFGSALYKGDISNTDIKINFNRFNPVNHRQLNMEVSGDASLTGKKGEVVFSGDITIPESVVYLPFVMNMMGVFNTPEIPKPILLREFHKVGELKDSIANVIVAETIKRSDTIKTKYFENFTGKINIKIPKNSWVKNEDFRIELSGDLELLKNKEYFEIFGTVNVVRGQYDLFGRTFIIDKGTVNFQGGEELKPDLNITATYTFRNDQRVEQKLTVNITGSVSLPSISFTLDGSSVSEGDALSYILFGRGLNELSLSQQENLSGSSGLNMAKTSVSSLLASQITKFLGNKLNVDFIEIKSDGSFETATVSVGKYITNDLFVNYEQQFGENTNQDADRYRVELEYELFKFLFIQLNNSSSDSGFNVIIKIISK